MQVLRNFGLPRLGCRKWGCNKWGLRGCLAALPGNRPILPFLPFSPFSGGCEEHLGNPENRRKRPFSSDSQVCLNPHLLNPHLRHSNLSKTKGVASLRRYDACLSRAKGHEALAEGSRRSAGPPHPVSPHERIPNLDPTESWRSRKLGFFREANYTPPKSIT